MGVDSIYLTVPKDVLSSIGRWVRSERQRYNWTQGDLAVRSGVPAATISRLERTGLADLRRLAERVGVRRGDAEAILDAVSGIAVRPRAARL